MMFLFSCMQSVAKSVSWTHRSNALTCLIVSLRGSQSKQVNNWLLDSIRPEYIWRSICVAATLISYGNWMKQPIRQLLNLS